MYIGPWVNYDASDSYSVIFDYTYTHTIEMATASERRSLQLEINMMKDLGAHRHLVSMLACCSDVTRLALVLEYVPGGNLHSYLRKHRQNVSM